MTLPTKFFKKVLFQLLFSLNINGFLLLKELLGKVFLKLGLSCCVHFAGLQILFTLGFSFFSLLGIFSILDYLRLSSFGLFSRLLLLFFLILLLFLQRILLVQLDKLLSSFVVPFLGLGSFFGFLGLLHLLLFLFDFPRFLFNLLLQFIISFLFRLSFLFGVSLFPFGLFFSCNNFRLQLSRFLPFGSSSFLRSFLSFLLGLLLCIFNLFFSF